MTKRWNVHHGNENLGLKTAKEIREALRKGTLDPFDKVSAEGSNIREDLIEVDEIFKETQEDEEFTSVQQVLPTAYMGGGASRARPQLQPQPQAPSFAPTPKLKDPIPRGPDVTAPRTNPPPSAPAGVPSPSWRTDPTQAFKDAADSKDAKSNQKRYYLIDKSKILGPLSGLEIQSLFNRGLLNQKVKVQRIGGTRSIPVAQFISTYSEDRLKELTDDGTLNQKVSSPSSKVLNELARVANAQKIAKTRKNKTYLILVAAGILFGIFLFVVWDSSSRPSSSKRSEAKEERDNADGNRRGSRPKLLQKSQDEDEDDGRTNRPAPKAAVQQSRPAPKAAVPAPEPPRNRTKVAVKPTKKAPPTIAAPLPVPTPSPAKSAPQRVVQKAAPVQAPMPSPAPTKVEKDGPIARALSSNRPGIQTIGPLSFNMGALDSCPSKCTLTFKDASGATLKAVFFKGAYYDQLKKSSGSVSLTGSTRKESGELTIFIQDIR